MLIIVFATTLVVALIAGLFYAYACSVSPGLGRLPDREYLSAMQAINRAILNPWFFFSFLGAVVLLPVCTWIVYRHGTSTSFYCLLGATAIYWMAVFGVTMLRNVPLNEELDKLNIANASGQELAAQRSRFEQPWNRYHLVRTLAAAASLMLVLLAFCSLSAREE